MHKTASCCMQWALSDLHIIMHVVHCLTPMICISFSAASPICLFSPVRLVTSRYVCNSSTQHSRFRAGLTGAQSRMGGNWRAEASLPPGGISILNRGRCRCYILICCLCGLLISGSMIGGLLGLAKPANLCNCRYFIFNPTH
jgi:hypothetical protein